MGIQTWPLSTFFSLCNFYCLVYCTDVHLAQGILQGTRWESRGGREFFAFVGIPYAEPPVGKLRFKGPVPHQGWSGVRNATKEGSICAQELTLIPSQRGILVGNEDCLFLNVYTPEIKPTKKFPVLVFIHGGAFQMGDSRSNTYGPFYLLDKDVVYVNMNYRLGALGFLSLESEKLPGNFGLKDQVLALKWVKENIEHFGGDSNQITIFGESAGGASVHFHLLSPRSQGLFHRAIMQSGSSFCAWATTGKRYAKIRAQTFSVHVGCYEHGIDVLKCLQDVPLDLILSAQSKFNEWGIDPIVPFSPVVEVPHEDAFITKHTYLYNSSPRIPLMIGYNKDEGAMRTSKLCADGMKELNELNDRWERYLPLTLFIRENADPKNIHQIVNNISEYYLGNKRVDETNIRNLSDIYGDLLIKHCVLKAAEHHGSKDVYFYLYDYLSQVSWTSVFGNCSVPLGVCHADELVNLFNLESLFGKIDFKKEHLEMSKTMIDLWTNFASEGAPTNENSTFKWKPFTSKNKDYLYIGQNEITMKQDPLGERYDLIESLPMNFQSNYMTITKKVLKRLKLSSAMKLLLLIIILIIFHLMFVVIAVFGGSWLGISTPLKSERT